MNLIRLFCCVRHLLFRNIESCNSYKAPNTNEGAHDSVDMKINNGQKWNFNLRGQLLPACLRSSFCAFLIFLLFLSDYVHCMQMKSVKVPRYETVGSSVHLSCDYDEGDDKLYTVKWYKDRKEFYRFRPLEKPPSLVFNVSWIDVDMQQSDAKKVVLRDLALKSSGNYTCEVIGEAPRFSTVSNTKEMKVLDLPDSRPYIAYNNDGLHRGNSSGYRVSDIVDVNCTSPRSNPPALLQWFVNDEKVNQESVTRYQPINETTNGRMLLYTSMTRLQFPLKRIHFKQGRVVVKCIATIYKEYFQSNTIELIGIGLGEKVLGISERTNGESRTSPQTMSMTTLMGGMALLVAGFQCLV